MNTITKVFLLIFLFGIMSCGREFLDIKRDANQVILQTIDDYQAILDKTNTMNEQTHDLGNVSADEYVVSDEIWLGLTGQYEYQKNAYVWNREIFAGRDDSPDWDRAYQRISYANLALDIENIDPSPAQRGAWENVKGTALFHRALAFYQLAQLFCEPYDTQGSERDLGIPLRMDYDVTVKYGRGTVKAVYQRIISDLTNAAALLPAKALTPFRPNRGAAYTLLSRVYLQMQDFPNAESFADRALELSGELLDYRTLDFSYTGRRDSPFPLHGIGNPEVLFLSKSFTSRINNSSRFDASPEILRLFETGDLRRELFFEEDGRKLYLGSYWGEGHGGFFTGLATDELFLIKAECLARKGDVQRAMEVLNELRRHRFDDSFAPLMADSPEAALEAIFEERIKELYMRGTRWEDLRRLNKEGRFTKTLVRDVAGSRYELPPNDRRWVHPIPRNEMDFSGFVQNPR